MKNSNTTKISKNPKLYSDNTNKNFTFTSNNKKGVNNTKYKVNPIIAINSFDESVEKTNIIKFIEIKIIPDITYILKYAILSLNLLINQNLSLSYNNYNLIDLNN